MQKPVEKPIKFIKNLATKGKSYPITHASAVIDDNGESIKSTIDSLKNKSSITKVTWKELKDKRDAGKLIPGTLYRITDYQCTTTQEDTRSAGHQFDIVLLALSENKLAEEGWAMMHENDTYFANSNLSAWKVWYCLDNDKSRFAWADDASEKSITPSNDESSYVRDSNKDVDGLYAWTNDVSDDSIYTKTTNPIVGDKIYDDDGTYLQGTIGSINGFGRGVIYRLIDEFNNDVAYDFKNIQYVRKLTDGEFNENGTDTWCYTLNLYRVTTTECQDASIIGNTLQDDGNNIIGVIYNKIENIISTEIGITKSAFMLSNNVLLSRADEDDFYYGIDYVSIQGGSASNTIFGGSSRITLVCSGVNYIDGCDALILLGTNGESISQKQDKMIIYGKEVVTQNIT